MAATSFLVGKMPDKTIVAIIEAVQEKYGMEHRSIQYSGLNLKDPEIEKLKERKETTYLLTEAGINTKSHKFTLDIKRNSDIPERIHYDTVTINYGSSPQPETLEVIEFADFVRQKMKLPSPDIPADADKSALGLLEQEIASLKALHDKMIADALDLRRTLEEQDALRKTTFEEAALNRELEISANEKGSLERIAKERVALDERLKEFDLSDHLRARRKLREDISNQVQDILKRPVSSGFGSLKLVMVMLICLIASMGSGLFAYETFQSFISSANLANGGASQISSPMLWMLAARGILLTAVCIGFAAYLVSMLRRSYDEDIHVQRELQRYGMDINRASWVIETAMEMTTKEGATLPERWVEGATHGLFASGKKADDPNALTALGAIMGLGPEVNVGPAGASFKLSSKGSKQAAKDAE